jgi:hypothetical protein
MQAPNQSSALESLRDELSLHPNNYPTLSDICPPLELKQFILDIHGLFQRRLKDKPLQTALLQLVTNFLNPRLRRTRTVSSASSSTKSQKVTSPKRKKNKK